MDFRLGFSMVIAGVGLGGCHHRAPSAQIMSAPCQAAATLANTTIKAQHDIRAKNALFAQLQSYVSSDLSSMDGLPYDGWRDQDGKPVPIPPAYVALARRAPASTALSCPNVRATFERAHFVVIGPVSLEQRVHLKHGWITFLPVPVVMRDQRHAFAILSRPRTVGLGGGPTAFYLEQSPSGRWAIVGVVSMGVS